MPRMEWSYKHCGLKSRFIEIPPRRPFRPQGQVVTVLLEAAFQAARLFNEFITQDTRCVTKRRA